MTSPGIPLKEKGRKEGKKKEIATDRIFVPGTEKKKNRGREFWEEICCRTSKREAGASMAGVFGS